MRIRLTLDITRRHDTQPDEQPEPPAVYDTAPAYIERDPSLDTEGDPETRRRIGHTIREEWRRPRIGFTTEED